MIWWQRGFLLNKFFANLTIIEIDVTVQCHPVGSARLALIYRGAK